MIFPKDFYGVARQLLIKLKGHIIGMEKVYPCKMLPQMVDLVLAG